jgi:hypothetical protein
LPDKLNSKCYPHLEETKTNSCNKISVGVTNLPIGGMPPTEDEDGGLLMFRLSLFNVGSDSELTILLPAILV